MSETQQALQHLAARLARNEVEEAASLYSRLSEDVGYAFLQRLPSDQGQRMRIAKMFFLAKDFQKAALVFEQSGEPEKAARLYEKADDYGMAAEVRRRADGEFLAGGGFELGYYPVNGRNFVGRVGFRNVPEGEAKPFSVGGSYWGDDLVLEWGWHPFDGNGGVHTFSLGWR